MSSPGAPAEQRGWYVDPDRSTRLRWWDGHAWGVDTIDPGTHAALAVSVRRWSVGLRAMLAVCGLLAALAAALDVSALGLVAAEDMDSFVLIERADSWSEASLHLASRSFMVMGLTGLVWSAWQYRLAGLVPSRELRHSREMHAGALFIPVVGLWRPLGMLSQLWRALVDSDDQRSAARTPVVFVVWWGLWVSGLLLWTGTYVAWFTVMSAESALPVLVAGIVGELCVVVAARLAVVVVRRTTQRAQHHAGSVSAKIGGVPAQT